MARGSNKRAHRAESPIVPRVLSPTPKPIRETPYKRPRTGLEGPGAQSGSNASFLNVSATRSTAVPSVHSCFPASSNPHLTLAPRGFNEAGGHEDDASTVITVATQTSDATITQSQILRRPLHDSVISKAAIVPSLKARLRLESPLFDSMRFLPHPLFPQQAIKDLGLEKVITVSLDANQNFDLPSG
jgi:hypothetical protein